MLEANRTVLNILSCRRSLAKILIEIQAFNCQSAVTMKTLYIQWYRIQIFDQESIIFIDHMLNSFSSLVYAQYVHYY
jgi:hypothetical protein